MVFLLLSLSSFLNLPPFLTRHNTVFSPSPPPFSMPRFLSTPRLESVKAKIVRDQKTRTDRKVETLLRPRQTRADEEISDDSEEDNRVRARRALSNRDQATQTDKSYSFFVVASSLVCVWFFCCGSSLVVDGTPHCNIRRDFVDTKHGIAPRPIIE